MKYDKHGLQLSGGHDIRGAWLHLRFRFVLVEAYWKRQAATWSDPAVVLNIRISTLVIKLQITEEHAEAKLCVKI